MVNVTKSRSYTAFLLVPIRPEFMEIIDATLDAVRRASQELGTEIHLAHAASIRPGLSPGELFAALSRADLIISDTSGNNPNVLWETGIAYAQRKPLVLITRDPHYYVPFFVGEIPYLIYQPHSLRSLIPRLQDAIVARLQQSKASSNQPTRSRRPRKVSRTHVFVSYSHSDAACLERLLVHLRPLEKAGKLDLWSDRKIQPGDRWKERIREGLKKAKVAVLLVSADFLASDFVVDNELPPLLKAAEAEGVRILPVILKPCRFLRDENLSTFQAVNDPAAPLLKLSPIEQEEVYARLAELIEKG